MLVGRRLAIGALGSAVDSAVGGAGGVVLLAGEAGMGKTALASEAVAYAKARGAAAVWGACWEGDGAPGFWPWIQVVRALVPEGGDAGEAVLAELTGSSEERGGGVLGDESAIRFRTYDMAATYVRRRAAQRPLVVVVIDDLHWADVSSLRLLVFLARQLHDAAALVIGTYRDVEVAAGDHPARPLLAELAAALVASTPSFPAGYRWRHTAMLTIDAELAAAVADRRRCAALYEQLLPMADEFAVVGAAVFTTGPVVLQLGLLAAPGREVPATELVAGVHGGAAAAIAALGADPVLDDRARAAYRARLADLDDELAEADARHDIERSARLAAERDALIGELVRATGLGSRRRRLGDAAERARTTVTARIRDAIGRIERAHPELGRHLRASIVTGTRCAYRSAETVRWRVSQS